MEWFEGDGWSPAERDEFERRIARATGHRAHYLAQKGAALIAAEDGEKRRAGRSVLQRVLDEHPNDYRAVAAAQRSFALEAERDGDIASAIAAYKTVLTSQDGHGSTGTELDLAELIVQHGVEDSFDDAEGLLDRVLGFGPFFWSEQFRYCVARARIAARRGRGDEAATFASGAVWLFRTNQPAAPRHPTVGLIDTDQKTLDELAAIADRGDPSHYDPRVARALQESGNLDWRLISRLKQAAGDDGRQARREQAIDAEDRVVTELREGGIEILSFQAFSLRGIKRKASAVETAEKLLRAYAATEDLMVKSQIASAIDDRRVAAVAKDALIEAFKELRLTHIVEGVPPRTEEEGERVRLKESLARSVGALLGAGDVEEALELIHEPEHGWLRAYIFLAIPRMRQPEAVNSMIDLLDDPELGIWALRALSDLKADGAETHLASVAAESYPKGKKGEEADRQRLRVDLAKKGLEKLAKAREGGRQIT